MLYVEIYADDKGVSHFRDVNVELTRGEAVPPALPIEFSKFRAANGVGFVSMPSKWVEDWHQPPAEGYVFVLSGEVQIEVGDGEIRRFSQGSIWLHKDRNGRGHHTRVISDEAANLVMVMFSGE